MLAAGEAAVGGATAAASGATTAGRRPASRLSCRCRTSRSTAVVASTAATNRRATGVLTVGRVTHTASLPAWVWKVDVVALEGQLPGAHSAAHRGRHSRSGPQWARAAPADGHNQPPHRRRAAWYHSPSPVRAAEAAAAAASSVCSRRRQPQPRPSPPGPLMIIHSLMALGSPLDTATRMRIGLMSGVGRLPMKEEVSGSHVGELGSTGLAGHYNGVR